MSIASVLTMASGIGVALLGGMAFAFGVGGGEAAVPAEGVAPLVEGCFFTIF